jgi:hypothetical protein
MTQIDRLFMLIQILILKVQKICAWNIFFAAFSDSGT